MKRILEENISPDGSLNNDKILGALLEYRNTPLPDINLSPAQILFHRQLRDNIPTHRNQYHLHKEWVVAANERERIFAERNKAIAEKYNQHARLLPELSVGTSVLIQGENKKWVKQGVIVEKLENRQYRIKVCGSGRVTLRNRRFIRPCRHAITTTAAANQYRAPSCAPQQIVPVEYNLTQHTVPLLNNPSLPSMAGRNNEEPASTSSGSSTETVRVPRALRNLQTHNNPGLNEQPVNRRRRGGGREG